jgi:hypothetical protein
LHNLRPIFARQFSDFLYRRRLDLQLIICHAASDP